MPENPIELLKFIREVQHFLLQTRNRRSTILATCLYVLPLTRKRTSLPPVALA